MPTNPIDEVTQRRLNRASSVRSDARKTPAKKKPLTDDEKSKSIPDWAQPKSVDDKWEHEL